MTVFRDLRKKYNLRKVPNRSEIMRHRPIKNPDLISRFVSHWNENKNHAHQWPGQPWYSGIGLHYSEKCQVMPLTKQVCGNDGRPDYQDTMAYDREIFPGLLEGFGPFRMVRCKITCLSGTNLGAQINCQGSWHRDESPFEVLRVVIPLESDLTYLFQMDDRHPIALVPGNAYAFDQSIYHRVYSRTASSLDRTHLILSFVTWFELSKDGWVPGPFFNRKHPLDLFDMISL